LLPQIEGLANSSTQRIRVFQLINKKKNPVYKNQGMGTHPSKYKAKKKEHE
jgi:hypothetical protein